MDKEQFTNEILKLEKSLYYTAKSILGNDEDCADVLQNAILKAFANLDSLREEQYFKTWMTKIVLNESYAMIRKNKATVSYEEYMENAAASDSQAYSEIYMEIQALEEKYRLPFVLHYVNGFTLKEIAAMLGNSEAGIKMRLLRARDILKKQLAV